METSRRRLILTVALLVAVFVVFHHRAKLRPEQPADAKPKSLFTDFSFVDGRIFVEKARPKKPSYRLLPTNSSFTVEEYPPAPKPALRDSLFARLTGPDGEHFTCFLIRSPNGTHYCPTAAKLQPGQWEVTVTLLRSPVPRKLPGCVPQGLLPDGRAATESTFSLVDYVMQGNFPTFGSFLKCFQYPYEVVVRTTWTKPDVNSAEDADADSMNANAVFSDIQEQDSPSDVCLGPGGPGLWMPLPRKCERSGLCQGEIDAKFIENKDNIDRNLLQFFKPFGCRPQFWTVESAQKCARNLSLVLSGDSRTMHLHKGFETWLGKDAVDFIPIYRPYRLGLTHAMATAAGQHLIAAIRSGRTVLINSVLHDIAEFYSTTTYSDAKKGWGKYLDCPEECEGKLALECGCTKQWAIKAYFESIAKLRDEIKKAKMDAVKQGNPMPRVFWFSIHKRPPNPPDVFYDWQTADLVRELESAAAQQLESVGVEHIDLRYMTTAAPGHWWDDPVHFGKKRYSLFLHMTLQAIMSKVCVEY